MGSAWHNTWARPWLERTLSLCDADSAARGVTRIACGSSVPGSPAEACSSVQVPPEARAWALPYMASARSISSRDLDRGCASSLQLNSLLFVRVEADDEDQHFDKKILPGSDFSSAHRYPASNYYSRTAWRDTNAKRRDKRTNAVQSDSVRICSRLAFPAASLLLRSARFLDSPLCPYGLPPWSCSSAFTSSSASMCPPRL